MKTPALLSFLTLAYPLFLPAASPFHLYAPSSTTQQLWVIAAKPAGGGLEMSVERKVDMGFPGRSITAHSSKEVLYVGASVGPVENVPAATVTLDGNGGYLSHAPFVLKHGTAYLSTDPANRFLLSASYVSGAVDVYALNASGVPTKWVAGRDEGRKNAHCVLPSPDGRFIYIPYVKETNALFQYRFNEATGDITPMEPLDVLPPSGTGPRHMVYHPKLPVLYFSNEQHLGVSVYDRDAEGRLKFRKVCDAVASDEPKEGISSSDIVITPDGRFLFAGIRGHTRDFNWITRYRIDDAGDVTLLGRTPADKIPWGFALSPDGEYLVVTAYEGGSITAYRTTKDGDLVKAASIACDKNISDIVAR